MIKTKTAFLIFAFLCIIVFPYYIAILCINSDFFNSIIPGWHTNIVGGKVILNLIKFAILSIVTFYYWKLFKIKSEINFKKFFIHLLLTLPSVLIAKLNLADFIDLNFNDLTIFASQIKMLAYIRVFSNILFLLGQILFWRFYVKFQKNI
ncbi:hypothetical protein [Flavobacterium aquidurense]|uniref:hypothetical protein n=1 Tax=Flavobacterium aquidurense TaxID=362413 RepID=UPI00285A1733|nr:hypothetical protein [Flavobacterium aquidurense]MDR7370527.1 hypothetical protein [Flavobacterium aquidurense]